MHLNDANNENIAAETLKVYVHTIELQRPALEANKPVII